MSDTFAYCGCQYEPDQDFQREHWHEEPETGIVHCDICDTDIHYEVVEYGVDC